MKRRDHKKKKAFKDLSFYLISSPAFENGLMICSGAELNRNRERIPGEIRILSEGEKKVDAEEALLALSIETYEKTHDLNFKEYLYG